jgi:hypothetical protein
MKYLIVVIALALTACGTAGIKSESTNTIVVDENGLERAIPLAEGACKRKGLSSHVVKSDEVLGRYVFECY